MPKVEKVCKCGKNFSVPYGIRRVLSCSKSCAKIGTVGPNKGKKWSLETREKISKTLKGMIPWNKGLVGYLSGDKHYNWKGGYSQAYRERRNGQYAHWRKQVFGRDDYTCRDCGIKGVYITAHHVKSFAYYPNLRYEIDNGLTLCEPCHSKTDNYKGRGKIQLASI